MCHTFLDWSSSGLKRDLGPDGFMEKDKSVHLDYTQLIRKMGVDTIVVSPLFVARQVPRNFQICLVRGAGQTSRSGPPTPYAPCAKQEKEQCL